MESSPERALWIAVIAQAIDDALMEFDGGGLDKKIKRDRRKIFHQGAAADWLTSGRLSFKMVCLWAGLDEYYVQYSYKKMRQKKIAELREKSDDRKIPTSTGN